MFAALVVLIHKTELPGDQVLAACCLSHTHLMGLRVILVKPFGQYYMPQIECWVSRCFRRESLFINKLLTDGWMHNSRQTNTSNLAQPKTLHMQFILDYIIHI